MHQKSILKAEEVTVSIRSKKILSSVNMSLQEGAITGLLGCNGAGKTTLFHTIIGSLQPAAGSIVFAGQDITKLPIHKRSTLGIGYLAQEPSIFRNLTVEENLLAYLETMRLSKKDNKQKLEQALEELNLSHLAKKRAFTLSGGEKRRTEIARALIKDPKLILLDEPFANIDPITISDVKNLITMLKNRGISILITDHNAREIFSLVDHCFILHNRSILESGSPEQLIHSTSVKTHYLGESFEYGPSTVHS